MSYISPSQSEKTKYEKLVSFGLNVKKEYVSEITVDILSHAKKEFLSKLNNEFSISDLISDKSIDILNLYLEFFPLKTNNNSYGYYLVNHRYFLSDILGVNESYIVQNISIFKEMFSSFLEEELTEKDLKNTYLLFGYFYFSKLIDLSKTYFENNPTYAYSFSKTSFFFTKNLTVSNNSKAKEKIQKGEVGFSCGYYTSEVRLAFYRKLFESLFSTILSENREAYSFSRHFCSLQNLGRDIKYIENTFFENENMYDEIIFLLKEEFPTPEDINIYQIS
jgi:hypothetical protein